MKLRTLRPRFELNLARSLTLGAAFAALVMTAALSACGPSYPNCDGDDDCHAGEFCVNNMCQQCRTDEDCGAGNRCAAGACEAIPGYCTSNGDCGAGQECRNNLCVTAAQAVAAPPPPAAGPCTLTAAYFAFDSSTLDPSARDQLSRNAECIKQRGIASVHLTGLCDPRGTEEYNLALGDRRASSARDYLQSLGVQAQITHSSMGEELAVGTDEATWSRDRRVDFSER